MNGGGELLINRFEHLDAQTMFWRHVRWTLFLGKVQGFDDRHELASFFEFRTQFIIFP